MSTTHLTKGSQEVPLQEGKLRLYSSRFCPYAQRVHLILNVKNIPHDVVYVCLKSKPEWFLEKFPAGKVPSIQFDGAYLYESLIIADLLDERYPQYPLYPKDPLRKAQDRLIIDSFKEVASLVRKIMFSAKLDTSIIELIFKEMDFFEKQLNDRGTTFFSGDKPGMVDYMIWPWIERLEIIKLLGGDQFKIPRDRFQKMWDWSKMMLDDEAVKKHYLTPEQHKNYRQSLLAGTPQYNL